MNFTLLINQYSVKLLSKTSPWTYYVYYVLCIPIPRSHSNHHHDHTGLLYGILLLIILIILMMTKLNDLNDHLGLRRVRRCSSARGWVFPNWLLLHGTKEGQVVMVVVVVVVQVVMN